MYFHSLRLLVLVRVDMKIIPQDVVIPSEAPCLLCIQQTGCKYHPLKIAGEKWTLAMPHISISGPTQVAASLYNSLASTASHHALDVDSGRLSLASNHCRKGFLPKIPSIRYNPLQSGADIILDHPHLSQWGEQEEGPLFLKKLKNNLSTVFKGGS